MAERECPYCHKVSDFPADKWTCCLVKYTSGIAAKLLYTSKNWIYLAEKKGKIAPVNRQKRNNYRVFTDADLFRFRQFLDEVVPPTTIEKR